MAPNTEKALAEPDPAPRYERKFRVDGGDRNLVELSLMRHPAMFRQVFHEREVHSIYFDTHDFRMYFNNIDGDAERDKIRVRWYGDRFGRHEAATLERKRKFGLVGTKDSFRIDPVDLHPGIDGHALVAALTADNVPPMLRAMAPGLRAVVLISYRRRYFLTTCGRFRATIDDQLRFVRLEPGLCSCLQEARDDGVILELKYGLNDDASAAQIASMLPFRMTRNSKYVVAVDKLFTVRG
jgi:hypothetical protein